MNKIYNKQNNALLISMGISFFVDRITKYIVLKTLGEKVFYFGFIELMIVKNTGAAFGILEENTIALGVLGILVLVFFFYLVCVGSFKNLFSKISTGVLLGGIMGNTWDRIFFRFVIDFMHFPFFPLSVFQVFNIADICITFGAVGLVIDSLRGKKL